MEEEKKDQYTNKPKVEVIETNETFEKEIFTIVNHNGEFLVALGNNIVSKEKFDCREKAERYIDSKPWELIFNGTAVMVARLNEIEKQTKK